MITRTYRKHPFFQFKPLYASKWHEILSSGPLAYFTTSFQVLRLCKQQISFSNLYGRNRPYLSFPCISLSSSPPRVVFLNVRVQEQEALGGCLHAHVSVYQDITKINRRIQSSRRSCFPVSTSPASSPRSLTCPWNKVYSSVLPRCLCCVSPSNFHLLCTSSVFFQHLPGASAMHHNRRRSVR